jgi:tRNA(Ile)-lysidine synthase
MYKGVKIYRPLLNKWKNELLTYCQRNQIEYGIDETNQTDLYERNRIRKALSTITSKEKENEFKRIVRSNKNKQKKYCEVIKKYDLWKLHNFALSFYQKSSKFIHEHLIYQFLIENNIHKISLNKIKLIDQFLNFAKTKTKIRLGRNCWLQKIDGVLVLKQES